MRQVFRQTKPQISFFERATLNFPAHIHDEIELAYVKRGGGTAWRDGRKYILTEDSFFLTLPNQVHYYTDFEEGEYLVLIMKPSCLLRYGEVFSEGTLTDMVGLGPGEEKTQIVYLVETAYRNFVRNGYSDVIAAYLTALFGKLLPLCSIEKAEASQDNVLRILQFCANHYKEDLSVESVAENLSVSRSCVSHIFSRRICMNFCDYINLLRLQEAETLLRNRHYSITEIANRSGFATIRTFNRAFLKKHGIAPTAYRKSL